MEDKMNGRLITPEEEEKIRYESVTYGDSFMAVKRLSESELFKSLNAISTPPEDERVPYKMELVEFEKTNKNKNSLSRDEMVSRFINVEEIFKDYKKYKMFETKRMSTFYGDCFVVSPMTIHRDDIDKNLRGMTATHMYVDDFYYNLPEPPDTTAIEVIQTTDYERLSRIADFYSYSHHLMDAFVLDAMIEEKEKNNDITVSKISYRCSIPCNNGMHDTNHTEIVSALRRRLRHR